MSDPDVLVLRQTIHGLGPDELASAIRERLPDATVARARTPAEELELIRTARVAVGLNIDEELLAAGEELELFACVFAGTGHLPSDLLADHGVAVTNASGVHGPNIAEHVGWRRSTSTRSASATPRRKAVRPTKYTGSTSFTRPSPTRSTSS